MISYENDIYDKYFTLKNAVLHIPQIAPDYLIRRAEAKNCHKKVGNIDFIKKEFIYDLKRKVNHSFER